jgi:hypothetical protein
VRKLITESSFDVKPEPTKVHETIEAPSRSLKGKIAATVILVYAILAFVLSLEGALLRRNFSIYTVIVSGLLCIGPAIGIYRRVNWCRIFLGVFFGFIFALCLILPFATDFHFRAVYLVLLLGSGLPVYLLFMYSPLKEHTRKPLQTKPES